jgi:hypothetical protein
MTIPACHGEILILIVDVTAIACDRLVRARQRKARRAMVERRWPPAAGPVALCTIMAEVGRYVVGV